MCRFDVQYGLQTFVIRRHWKLGRLLKLAFERTTHYVMMAVLLAQYLEASVSFCQFEQLHHKYIQ